MHRFFLDRSLANGSAVIFLIAVSLMVAASALVGRFFETLHVSVLMYMIVLLVWYTLFRGVFITIEDGSLRVTRFFFTGKPTLLSDVISIRERPIFMGLVTEVYMEVQKLDGTFRKQGLINKPGLKDNDMSRLIELICSRNPQIKVDVNISR